MEQRLLEIHVLAPDVLDFDAAHRCVRCKDGGTVDVLPFGIASRCLEQALLFVGCQRPADRGAAVLGEHLDVVLKTPPLLEPLEHPPQGADVHVDRAVARTGMAPRLLKALNQFTAEGGELDIAEVALRDV